MAQNGSCSVVLDHVGTNNSEEHRLASLVYGCIMCLLIVATLMIWFPRRKHPYLRSRNLQIVAVSSLGFFMEVLANAFVRADPTMPCELVVFCFYNAGVFLVWPATARLWLKHNIIKYYQLFAKKSLNEYTKEGEEERSEPLKVERLRWRTTTTYARLIVLGPLVANTIFALVISLTLGCSCTDKDVSFFAENTVLALVYFLGLLVFILSSKIYVARKIKDVPDPLGVNIETMLASLSASSIILFGFAFVVADLGEYRLMKDAPWNWAWLIDFAFMFHFFFLGPLPLILSFCRRSHSIAPVAQFKELMKDKRGVESLSQFLATEMSLENLLFLVRLREWEGEFPKQSKPERKQSCDAIYEEFVKLNSRFELNISAKLRDKVESALDESEEPQTDVFEPVVQEVEHLIRYHSWPRFRKSVFYKLYAGLPDDRSPSILL